MQKIVLAISYLTLLIVSGCSSVEVERKQNASSGLLGCSPQEITIKDLKRASWTAICKEKKYYCSYAGASAKCSEPK